MRDRQGGGGGILAALALAVCAVLYFEFHMVRFGWILKIAFALLVLFVVFCVAAVAWVIWDAGKQRKKREEEEERKRREAELRKFNGERG